AEPALDDGDEIVAQGARRGGRQRGRAQRIHDRHDEAVAVGPAPVEGGLAGAGSRTDGIDADGVERALLDQQGDCRLDELVVELFGKGASARALVAQYSPRPRRVMMAIMARTPITVTTICTRHMARSFSRWSPSEPSRASTRVR